VQADLAAAINIFLDIYAYIVPWYIRTKLKLHLMLHIPDDAYRFGPLVGRATENFECFNAIFRYCSIFSNHHAPSRDIAIQLAKQEGLKRYLTGGCWENTAKQLTHAGPAVLDLFKKHPILQDKLGWHEEVLPRPGSFFYQSYNVRVLIICSGFVKLVPQKRRTARKWSETKASSTVNAPGHEPTSLWVQGMTVEAMSQDSCHLDSWVFARYKSTVHINLKLFYALLTLCFYRRRMSEVL
jgi:hypothetical protein